MEPVTSGTKAAMMLIGECGFSLCNQVQLLYEVYRGIAKVIGVAGIRLSLFLVPARADGRGAGAGELDRLGRCPFLTFRSALASYPPQGDCSTNQKTPLRRGFCV